MARVRVVSTYPIRVSVRVRVRQRCNFHFEDSACDIS